ncbi:MAG: hypothetical protein ACQERF_09530 [Actinomycetota bacterium]
MNRTQNRPLISLPLKVSSGRRPLDDRGWGAYTVRNDPLLSARQVGDVVQVTREWNGWLALAGIEHLSEGILTEVHFPHDERDRVVKKAVRAWRRQGAHHTEQYPGVLRTSWPPSIFVAAVHGRK